LITPNLSELELAPLSISAVSMAILALISMAPCAAVVPAVKFTKVIIPSFTVLLTVGLLRDPEFVRFTLPYTVDLELKVNVLVDAQVRDKFVAEITMFGFVIFHDVALVVMTKVDVPNIMLPASDPVAVKPPHFVSLPLKLILPVATVIVEFTLRPSNTVQLPPLPPIPPKVTLANAREVWPLVVIEWPDVIATKDSVFEKVGVTDAPRMKLPATLMTVADPAKVPVKFVESQS
jgi:hypothetical protein